MYSLIMLCLAGSIIGLNYEKCRGYLLRTWGQIACSILGINVEVQGQIPGPPFMLVSNHLSYLDIFVLFSQVRGLFVAKSDVKTWPLVGFIIRTCGILFIDRNRKRDITRVNTLISKNVNDHQGIIIFPEGTTSPGYEILPFKTSLLKYPVAINLPVSVATLSYSTPEGEKPAYESVCWWDDTSFLTHFFNFLKQKGCTAKVTFATHPVHDKDRKLLAQHIHQEMSLQFEPVISEADFFEKHGTFKPLAI
ncbi:lysophospholipid acyltransferase family protein [Gracilimonas tropica]|uniref:lysophospholipid acyltransferase family protein n=1 Tax=Gracilimonas tropica TaxID=454600 RepID=UPI00036E90CC|nr:lysophospholipid acyltransferase family protein [Gracilimonas tropica]